MGWAKYVEDDMELRTERFYSALNESRFREDTYIEVRTVLPVTILPIEVSIAIATPKTSSRPDCILHCRDCGKQFVFSGKEQDFFDVRGYKAPKRCKRCRELNKVKHVAYGMERI